jgi:lauroyl/myristoyl acyltransferase
MFPLPRPILEATLTFQRTQRDVLGDLLGNALGQCLALSSPRGSLALSQMETLNVVQPKKALTQLYRTSSQELVRILRRRYHQIDQSPLAGISIPGPTLYLSYHFGNWEWLGGILSNLHGDFRPVTRSIRSPRAHRLVQSLRQNVGMNSMIDHQGLRGGRIALEEKAMLAFLADQTPPGSSRPGICLERSLPVSTLPEWWTKDKSFRWITGHLLASGKNSYTLALYDLPSEHIHQWDQILDQHLCPILRTHPHHYFGWWHHRLTPRTRK